MQNLEHNQRERRFAEAILNCWVLGIPVVIAGDIVLEIQWGSVFLVLQYLFAVWLSCYFLHILFREYILFSELHALKHQPFDGLLVIGVFISVRQFSHAGENVPVAFTWMCLGLALLIIWEFYTMMAGREKYFKTSRESLKPIPMVQHFINCFRFKLNKEQSSHWDEYRYWLMLDLILLVAAFATVELCRRIQDAGVNRVIQVSLLSLAFGLCIVNLYRYRLMLNGLPMSRTASD